MTREAYVSAVAEGRARLRDQLLDRQQQQQQDEDGQEAGGWIGRAGEQEDGGAATTVTAAAATGEGVPASAASGAGEPGFDAASAVAAPADGAIDSELADSAVRSEGVAGMGQGESVQPAEATGCGGGGQEAGEAEASDGSLHQRSAEEEMKELAAAAEQAAECEAVEAQVSELLVLFVEPGVGHVETAAMNRAVRQFLDRHLLAGLRPAGGAQGGGDGGGGGGGFSASIRRNAVAL